MRICVQTFNISPTHAISYFALGSAMKNLFPLILCSFMIFSLAACGSRTQTHGRLIEESRLDDIEIGTSTQRDIIDIFGQPSFKGAFGSGKIYYNNQTMVREVAGLNELTARTLFIFSFDNNDVLQDIEVRDKESDISIVKIDRKTPTPGENLGVLDQMFSNLRKRSAE